MEPPPHGLVPVEDGLRSGEHCNLDTPAGDLNVELCPQANSMGIELNRLGQNKNLYEIV